MDKTQYIALLAVIAAVIAALIAGSAQIFSAIIQKLPSSKKPHNTDDSGRWPHIIDPNTASLEERIVAAHLEASMAKKPSTSLKIIEESDSDAKQ